MSTAHGRLRSRWSRERRCYRAVHVQQTTSRPRQTQRGSQLRYVVADDRRSVHENNRDRHQPLLVEILHCPVGRRNIPVDEVHLVLPKELLRALAELSTRSGVDDNAWCHGSILFCPGPIGRHGCVAPRRFPRTGVPCHCAASKPQAASGCGSRYSSTRRLQQRRTTADEQSLLRPRLNVRRTAQRTCHAGHRRHGGVIQQNPSRASDLRRQM